MSGKRVNKDSQQLIQKQIKQSREWNFNLKMDKSILGIQSLSNNQLPSFINRKVKNLKPYTNHFKKYNLQCNRLPDNINKKFNQKVLEKKNIQAYQEKQKFNQLMREGKYIKELRENGKKNGRNCQVSEISVYQQFLQKTNTAFSSFFQQFKNSNVSFGFKNKIFPINQLYNCRGQSKNIQQKESKNHRRSLGAMELNEKDKKNHGEKSVNLLMRNQEGQQGFEIGQNGKQMNKIKLQEISKHNQFDEFRLQNNHDKKSNMFKSTIVDYSSELSSRIDIPQSAKTVKFTQTKNTFSQEGILRLKKEHSTIESGMRGKDHELRIKVSPQKFDNYNKLTNKNNRKQSQNNVNHNFKKNYSQLPSSVKNRNNNKVKSPQKIISINNNNNEFPSFQPVNIALPSNVTAFSYIIYEPSFSLNPKINKIEDALRSTNKIFNNNKIIGSLNCKTVVQIASLTKIMTFIVALQISENVKLNPQQEKIKIGKFESNINGTSAQIQEGEIYTLQQLFYGLMLPSGNDASLAIAIWGGKKLLIKEIKEKLTNKKRTSIINNNDIIGAKLSIDGYEGLQNVNGNQKIILKKKRCYERFILEMNKKARNLGMTKTNYANSHGLANNLNKSCAFDLAILCEYVMKNQKFKKVVSTVHFTSIIQVEFQFNKQKQKYQKYLQSSDSKSPRRFNNSNQQQANDYTEHQNQHSDEQSSEELTDREDNHEKAQVVYGKKEIKWENTHKLLAKEEYIGIKTGITNTAGPCLASCIKTPQNRYFIIIVLNSKKINYRFKDTQTLKKWLFKRQKIAKPASSPSQPSLMQNKKQKQIQSHCQSPELTSQKLQTLTVQTPIIEKS